MGTMSRPLRGEQLAGYVMVEPDLLTMSPAEQQRALLEAFAIDEP